jgi:hypothetical protein
MSWSDKNVSEDVADYVFSIRLDCLPDRIGVFQKDIRPDISIDYDNLEQELQENIEKFVFWDLLLADQKTKVAALLRKKDIIRGKIVRRILDDAVDKEVNVRSSDMRYIINADPDLIDVEAEIIKEQRKEDRVRTVVNGLKMKSEHLRSLAGFKREEKREIR